MAKPLDFKDVDCDTLIKYCPLAECDNVPNSGPYNLCEGSHCEEAYENYVDDFVEDNNDA